MRQALVKQRRKRNSVFKGVAYMGTKGKGSNEGVSCHQENMSLIVKPTINFTLARLGNLASERVYSRNCCSLKCKHIFGFYYKQRAMYFGTLPLLSFLQLL